MIIWGSKGKEKKLNEGIFYCPACQKKTSYVHMKQSKYFTLYFIPLFETKKLGEYIECQNCYTPFKAEVLEYSNKALRSQHEAEEAIREVIQGLHERMNEGVPLQIIVQGLRESGVSEEDAKMLLFTATNGKFKVCEACEAYYCDTLSFCSLCGGRLELQNI